MQPTQVVQLPSCRKLCLPADDNELTKPPYNMYLTCRTNPQPQRAGTRRRTV